MTEETKDKSAEDVKTSPVSPEVETHNGRVKSFKAAIKKILLTVQASLMAKHPELTAELLVDFIHGGLFTLKNYIEDPNATEVSWANPWVESRYSVDWDWENGGILPTGPNLPESIIEALKGEEDPERLASSPETREVMTSRFIEYLRKRALLAFTHKVAVHVKGGETVGYSILDPEVQKELDATTTEEERTVRFEELTEPLSFGGLRVQDEDGNLSSLAPLEKPTGEGVRKLPLPPELAEALGTEGEKLPKIYFSGTVRGAPYQGSVVIMLYPLMVDEDRREAYFPILTGLVFAPVAADLKDLDLQSRELLSTGWDPTTWTEEERSRLWEELLVDLPKELREKLGITETKAVSLQFFVPTEEKAPEAPPTVVPSSVGPPPPERRYLLDAPTRIDRGAAVLVAHVGGLSLPRKWGSVKTWDSYEEDEVKRLQETYGDEAFKDLRRENNDSNAHGRLLVKRTNAQGETEIKLTKEAEDELLATVGHKGFRKIIKDTDGLRREYLIKRFRAASGHIEVRLSWYGQAWPLVDEGRKKAKMDLTALQEEARQGKLFDKLDAKIKEELNSRLRLMESIRDAREVMESILYSFGAVGENPLRVPAWNFKTLLECEKDPDGFRRVMGCLRALQEVRFYTQAAKIPGLSRTSFGPFLANVKYVGGGPGRHGDGDFFLTINPDFVDSLKVFQTTNYKIKDPYRVLYDWGKRLSKEEQKGLRYIKGFTSLAPYYDRARGFTPAQSKLRQWIEDNVTRNKDGTRKGGPSVRVPFHTADADEPRLYGRPFCPLLPEGRQFHGALAHFPGGRGEKGRTLFGTPTSGTKKSGGHKAGLLQVMGYSLPPGAARAKRAEIVRKALQDMRAVVEEAFGGMVVGLHEGQWLSLHDAEKLHVDILLKRVTWYLFLSTDWRDRIPKEVEDYHEKRRARGEVSYQVKTTKDHRLVERADVRRGLPPEAVGLGTEPLGTRLYIARNERKWSQTAVGKLFGVSRRMVDYWEKGAETTESGRPQGRPIPKDVARLVQGWVETGTAPTAEEMTNILSRRKKKHGGKGLPRKKK